MSAVELVRQIDALGLTPGDVIITGNRDPISAAIQRATGCQVSHVVVYVGEGLIVESTEYRNLADDRHGGVYLRPLADVLAGKYVDHVLIRRPVEVHHDSVRASARRFLSEQPVFSMSGVAFSGLLVILGQFWTEQVADFILGDERSTTLERHVADLVADGTRRLVCAELVYRVLHDAHVPLAHESLFLADAMRHVGLLAPPAPERGDVVGLDRLVAALSAAQRSPEAPDSESAIDELGWPTYLRLAARHIRRAYDRRRDEVDDGDIADLVTPRDFIAMQPFVDLMHQRLVDGRWTRL